MKRGFAWMLALMLALGALSGAAMAEGGDNWLHLLLPKDPETLDVQLTTDSYMIPLNCFDRLVETDTVDGQAQIVPGLAETWDVSDDGLTYTFHLREDVEFHNGDPFTADDVVFTVNRMMNPATAAKNTDIYDKLLGAMAVMNGEAETVEGVKALDDYTVEFKLEEPYAPFLSGCLSTPAGSIFNRESTEGVSDFGVNPGVCFGTGPFQVTDWSLGSRVVLEANPNYFRGAPAIDGITFDIVPDPDAQRMKFEKGEVDVFDFDYAPSQLDWFVSNGYKDQIVAGRRAGTDFFMFNTAIEPLNDAKVRQALQMAVDRNAMLAALYNGEGTVLSGFIPVGIQGYNPDAPEIPYDPEGAKALLAEAGYPDGFDMEIAVSATSEEALNACTVIASFFEAVGVRAQIKQYDSASYFDIRRDGALPSYSGIWSADYNDPDNFLYTFFSRKNTKGRSVNYGNEEIMDLLDQARTMVDQDARMAVYQKIDDAVVHQDAVTLPLYQRNHQFCLSPRVEGFKVAWNAWSDMSFYGVTLAK